MTEDFRCRECDRILTQSDEFDLGTCRDCEWRPAKHDFQEAPDGTCLTCGYVYTFGGLHVEPLAEVPDDPRPEGCRSCPHYAHSGACPDALPGYPKARPCPCAGESVAA